MTSLTVLVTGVGGGGHGEQILKALRLSEVDYTIVGTDISPYSKGLYEVDHAEIVPPANDPHYIERLLRICERHKVAAVFHGSEPELKILSRYRDQFIRKGIFLPLNPPQVIDLCMDKVRTFEFLKAEGFPVPAFRKVSAADQFTDFESLPAVLKPSTGGGGSANVFLAQTQDELRAFGTYLLSIYPEFIVQEYVGSHESEFTVGVLSSMQGELLNSIAVKRNILSALSNRLKAPNRTSRKELGSILAISNGVSQGEIGPFPEVTASCEQIALALGCCGSINIQCRVMNGKVYVFEINPRFSGTTSLRAMVGYNEPDVLVRKHVLGENIQPRFAYNSGTILRGLAETLVYAPLHVSSPNPSNA